MSPLDDWTYVDSADGQPLARIFNAHREDWVEPDESRWKIYRDLHHRRSNEAGVAAFDLRTLAQEPAQEDDTPSANFGTLYVRVSLALKRSTTSRKTPAAPSTHWSSSLWSRP